MIRRKDNKGRVLNDGEFQRPDGRYQYQYTDSTGKRKIVYSWKLNPTDKVPSGKRINDLSLREKEKTIKDDINNGIVSCGGNLTVSQLVERYISTKTNVRRTTRQGYTFTLNILKNNVFGTRRIDTIKLSDAKKWFISLQDEGKKYGSICVMQNILKPAFRLAVEDDLIKKNPFAFKLSEVIKNDKIERQALTPEQQEQFLNFIKHNKCFSKYYDGIFLLFNTGLRISEFCGLTISDIDFKNRKIVIDHQLLKRDGCNYEIVNTKTTSGNREIPMSDEVYNCLSRIIKNRNTPKVEFIVDGKVGFLFLNRNGMPTYSNAWEMCFNRILEKYNLSNDIPLPIVTPHICRHTFCSNMAKAGMNPKMLQYIMGHSNISMTLDTYTHVNFENAKSEMKRICNMK